MATTLGDSKHLAKPTMPNSSKSKARLRADKPTRDERSRVLFATADAPAPVAEPPIDLSDQIPADDPYRSNVPLDVVGVPLVLPDQLETPGDPPVVPLSILKPQNLQQWAQTGPHRVFEPGVRSTVQPPPKTAPRAVPAPPRGIGFADPARTDICLRRQSRREVMFATNRGGGDHKPPNRTQSSNYRC